MNTPEISVIIPAYNREQTIGRSIESVLAQTFSDIELIVVDDRSADKTIDVVRGFTDPRIRCVVLEKNGGVHIARNHGLEVSRGKFILFLDSDDELYAHALEKMHRLFSDESIGLVTAPYKLPDGSLTSFDRPDGEVLFEEYMCNRTMRPNKASLMLFRRAAIGELRWFEKNLDFVFCRRVAAKTRQYYISEPLASYHTQKGGTASSMTAQRKIPNAALSISRARIIADFARDFEPLLSKNCPQLYGYYAYGAAVGLLLGGESVQARNLAYAAAKNQPRAKYFAFYLFSLVPGSGMLLRILFVAKRSWLQLRKKLSL